MKDMENFISQVNAQLMKMTEQEKNAWILDRAVLLKESEQGHFLASLTGEKRVPYMPSDSEIDVFCEEVQSGEIYVEYETHYYEFNSEGFYVDDWEYWYNDPCDAMTFLNKVFCGCHDLLLLGEYRHAAVILDSVCCLSFQIADSEDSEDTSPDEFFTIENATDQRMLAVDGNQIGLDWIHAIWYSRHHGDVEGIAEKLVRIFKHPICKKLNPFQTLGRLCPDEVFAVMQKLLAMEIQNDEMILSTAFSKDDSLRKYAFDSKLKRKKELEADIRGRFDKVKEAERKPSVLQSSWKQIKRLYRELSYEPYIDDQMEIEEVWNISEALIRRGGLEKEDWNLRKEILREIVQNGYYDYFGCYDPMQSLVAVICATPEEWLEAAEIMDEEGAEKDAAEIYLKYGRRDKYVAYLERNLKKESAPYLEVANYYMEQEDISKAREFAELGLKNCKRDLTELFMLLLKDARNSGDEERYQMFYKSAKRRPGADMKRIEEEMSGMEML